MWLFGLLAAENVVIVQTAHNKTEGSFLLEPGGQRKHGDMEGLDSSMLFGWLR